MRNKTLVAAVTAALMASGSAYAQRTGDDPEGPSTGGTIEGGGALPGFTCSGEGGSNCSGPVNGGAVNSTFEIAGCGEILDVDVGLDISHTWVGDLIVTVAAPGAAPLTIVDRPGTTGEDDGCSGVDMFAVLDDAAPSPIETECAAATPTIDGAFTPNEALSAFDGLSADGTWTLNVSDAVPAFDNGNLNDWSVDVFSDTCGEPDADSEPVARFAVDKVFDDGNTGDVEVTLSCNTGLPLEQTTTISEGDGVVFIVNDFENGEMDCDVTETPLNGYSTTYDNGTEPSEEGCAFDGVQFELTNTCLIENDLESVVVEVTKEWIDENPEFNNVNFAKADYDCVNEQFVETSGSLEFIGNGATVAFDVFPHWDGTTTCSVTESVVEGGVEADSSDCQALSVTLGSDVACTIVNTRLFEGIPTLSQYGLGLLALLMLGMGFVAYRRVV